MLVRLQQDHFRRHARCQRDEGRRQDIHAGPRQLHPGGPGQHLQRPDFAGRAGSRHAPQRAAGPDGAPVRPGRARAGHGQPREPLPDAGFPRDRHRRPGHGLGHPGQQRHPDLFPGLQHHPVPRRREGQVPRQGGLPLHRRNQDALLERQPRALGLLSVSQRAGSRGHFLLRHGERLLRRGGSRGR